MSTEEELYAQITMPAFEGASTGYKLSQKGLLTGSPDTLAARELLNLQMRTAHAIRNNGYAETARAKYVTSLGAIKTTWRTKEGDTHPLMQELWEEFIANPNYDGYGTFDNTQSSWHNGTFLDGNAFTRMLTVVGDHRVPLKLQAVSATLHDVLYNGTTSSKNLQMGIRFKGDTPAMYYFRKGVYSDYWNNTVNSLAHVKIPANELIHIFHRDSVGQWIGIPKLSSLLITLYELDELTDATIAKQKAAQIIAWVVENTNPLALNATGAPTSVTEKGKTKVVFKAQGGGTQYLNKGEKLSFHQGTDIGANLPVLIKSELRKVAAAVGIPYHSLTQDTGDLDFSSLRAIATEFRQRIEYIHHFLTIPLGVGRVTTRFKELAELTFPVTEAFPRYQLPRWYGVDDLKDIQADLLEVQSGMGTLADKLDERQTSFEEVIKDRELIEKLGLEHLLKPNGDSTAQSSNIEANSNSSGS